MTLQYTVIFERAPSNWAAYVPDLPGCMSTGRTLDETKVNIREAIEGHLATLRALGDPVPEPCILAGEVEVSPAADATRGWPVLS
jgi:predicted RNase H-like HicB family nuclease